MSVVARRVALFFTPIILALVIVWSGGVEERGFWLVLGLTIGSVIGGCAIVWDYEREPK